MMRTHPLEIPEIISNILSCKSILGIKDLAVTSLVCKSWTEQSRRAQWSDVELNTESWIDPHYSTLSLQIRKYGSFVRNLTISDCGANRNRFKSLLLLMKNLQVVSVERLMLHANSSTTLRSLDSMQFNRLKYLKLPHVSTTSGGVDIIMRICNAASRIQHLELMDCEIDDDSLMFIAESCPELMSLDLSRNEAITFIEIINEHEDTLGYHQTRTGNKMDNSTSGKDVIATNILTESTNVMNILPTSATAIVQYENNPYSNSKQHNAINTENTPVDSYCPLGPVNQQSKQPQWWESMHSLTYDALSLSLSHHCTPSESLPSSKPNILQARRPFMFLEELSLVFCVGITNKEFQALFWSFQGKKLRSLNLQFTNIEDSGLETLVKALTPPKHKSGYHSYSGITSVNISYCSKITTRGINALVQGCPQLLELEFLSCDQVSADCFRGPTPWSCTNLKTLEFTFHPRVLFTKGRWRGEYTEPTDQTAASDDAVLQVEGDDSQTQNSLLQLGPSLSQDVDVVQLHNQQQQCGQALSEHEDDNERDQLHEKESVRNDYYAMFKQLGRLTQLQSLHIYNSPGLSSCANTLDLTVTTSQNEESPVDSPRPLDIPHHPVPDCFASSLEDSIYAEAGSSSTSRSNRNIATDDMFRSICESSSRMPQDFMLYGDELNASTSQACQKLPEPKPVQEKSLKESITLHPFTHKMGLKALGRLKKLRELTLYERSNIILGRSELLWIGESFPELLLLHLRGAIESSEEAIQYMKAKRPRIQVQICSLFESN
ncbi:hypothetical protein BGZ76_007030 [Entomortierella beljakovae]|nr:hypothetical protein BGZ76_007030 [Entomortierella beljakovae]